MLIIKLIKLEFVGKKNNFNIKTANLREEFELLLELSELLFLIC